MGSLKVALSSLLKFCTVNRINPSGLAVSSSITTSCGSLGEESPFVTVESPPASNEKNQIKRTRVQRTFENPKSNKLLQLPLCAQFKHCVSPGEV